MKKVYDIPKAHMRGNESIRRVYSEDEECPSLDTMCGGNREPKIAVLEGGDYDPCVSLIGGIGEMKSNGRTQCYNQDRVYDAYGLSTSIPTSFNPYYGIKENEPMEKESKYELSDRMQKYIVSKDDKYVVGKGVLNPTDAKSITTREGQTRADASSFLSPDCGDDTEIVANEDGYPTPKEEPRRKKLTIRKLTEGECYRLMAFEEEDEAACKDAGQSAANVYHQAGDSIVVTCLMAIFGELLGIDYRPIVEKYCDKLHSEVAS